MKQNKRDGNFRCDANDKKRVAELLKYKMESESNYIFEYEIPLNQFSEVDILATAFTQTYDVKMMYAIECKERDFNSTTFNDAMIEEDKLATLLQYSEQPFYRSYYTNTWKDGIITAQRITKETPTSHRETPRPKKTKSTTDTENKTEDAYYIPMENVTFTIEYDKCRDY